MYTLNERTQMNYISIIARSVSKGRVNKKIFCDFSVYSIGFDDVLL